MIDRRNANRRKDPRDFGRRAPPLDPDQLEARFAAVGCAIGAGIAFTGSALLACNHPDGSVLAGMVAFVLLMLAVVAAGEA